MTVRNQGADRHHPLLVSLHWALALLIIADLTLGATVLSHMPNTSPQKLQGLMRHATGGIAIFGLMLLRLGVRLRTAAPPSAGTGSRVLDRIAVVSHRAFYVLVFAMFASGLGLALQAHLPAVVLQGRGTLPTSFWDFPLRPVHYLISRLLIGLIGLHVAAVLYHTMLLKDRLLRRMSIHMPSRATMMGAAPFVARGVLILQGIVLTLIAARGILNPAGSAAHDQIALGSALAVSVYQVVLGAFPLAAALFVVGCAMSRGTLSTGLVFVATFDFIALGVRLYALGTLRMSLASSRGPLLGEAILGSLALLALALDRVQQRTAGSSVATSLP